MKNFPKAILLLLLFLSVTIASPDTQSTLNDEYEIKMVVAPKICNNEECLGGCTVDRLTNRWAFVIDTSSSMANVFPKARLAFQTAVQYPTDDFKFSMYLFNNRNNERYQDWTDGSVEAFEEADRWATQRNHQGVLSFGARAIEWAITGWAPQLNQHELITGGRHKTERNLTVIIISDGGFTENQAPNSSNSIRNTIEHAQNWREANGFPRAIIVAIGIENLYYKAKPPDKECQREMQAIGTRWRGGYFYVRRKE